MSFLDKIRELFDSWTKHDDDTVTVVVKRGDTLSGIAREITGDADDWHKIAELNPDLDDPDVIRPGQVLRIPKDWVD